jgi:hypothetical protein
MTGGPPETEIGQEVKLERTDEKTITNSCSLPSLPTFIFTYKIFVHLCTYESSDSVVQLWLVPAVNKTCKR